MTRPPRKMMMKRGTLMRRMICLITRTRTCTFTRNTADCTMRISYSPIGCSSCSMRSKTWVTSSIDLR